MESLGSKLHKLVSDSPCTIRHFASEVGTTTSTLNKIYNGKYVLSTELALRLEKLLGDGMAFELLHYQVDYLLWKVKNGEGEGFYRKNIHNT